MSRFLGFMAAENPFLSHREYRHGETDGYDWGGKGMDSGMVYEQEIDLKDLMFAVLRQWKKILLVGVVLAMLLGGVKAVLTYREENDEDAIKAAEEQFEADMASYERNKENKEREIGNLQKDIEKQQNYLEKSVLMNMSPYDVCEARADLFIKTDYEIMPGMVYQNVDYTDTILQTYQSVMTSTVFLSHIADDMGIDVQYLRELISIERGSTMISSSNVNKLTNLLTITVKHATQREAESVMRKLLDGIDALQVQIIENIGEHTVNMVNKSTGSAVDLKLADRQQEQNNQLINLQQTLDDKEKALEDLEEPKKMVSAEMATLKSAVKYGVIGGVLGAFVVVFFVCVVFVMSDKVYSSKELKTRFGIKILGSLPVTGKKKTGKAERLINRLEGREHKIGEAAEVELIAANICNYAGEAKRLLVTGSISGEKIMHVAKLLEEKLEEMNVISGDNMLQNAETIRLLPECDSVVLVEEANVSTYAMVERELEKVMDLQKKIVGCIVFEA